jgi:lipopolysaccharide export system permease protein
MKTINYYLWGATLQGILITSFALVTLLTFFAFIDEAGKTDAIYTNLHAAIYLVFKLPSLFYEYFPVMTLIGALLGLGALSANSEFTAMRAAGLSIKQLIFSVLKLGFILTLGIFIVGEWLVPMSDLHARNFKAHLKSKNIVLVGGEGLWVKERDSIIHIGKVISETELSDISIYTFKAGHKGLKTLLTSTKATAKTNGWLLEDTQEILFKDSNLIKNKLAERLKTNLIKPELLGVATVEPNQLSSKSLTQIIEHQKLNNLKSDKYELIYWKRYSVPLSALVMLLLAMPFLFGSNRSGGAGTRLFIGIVVGIVFSLVNRSINELGIVYGFSPIISAFLPLLLFLVIGLFAISRIR